jgi:hypothetical protein
MPILKRPGEVTTGQMRKAFEDEIISFVDKRDRRIIREAIEMIERCAVQEASIVHQQSDDEFLRQCGIERY